MDRIEYRVVPVTRWLCVRTEIVNGEGRSVELAEVPDVDRAYAAAAGMCRAEHEQLGYPPGDERIVYPAAGRRLAGFVYAGVADTISGDGPDYEGAAV